MNRGTILVGSLAGLILLAGGCSRVFKEGLGAATGAKGVAIPLKPVAGSPSDRPLGAYERFELGSITDGINGQTPPGLLTQLPAEFEKQLAAKKLPNPASGKTLVIRGEIRHYEASGLFGQAFGPLEEVIARIELVDKDSGNVLGVANCVGRTKESINMGVRAKAEGLAKAIVGWIDKLYPDDKRTNAE